MSIRLSETPIRTALLILALGSVVATAAEPDWRIAAGRLTTQWGDQVTPDNAWREYPRPQFVRAQWANLNGLWDYAITRRTAPAPASYEGKILVPFAVESALSGVARKFTPDDRLWYRRTWMVPAAWQGQRVLLHFGAVDFACTLWINGGLVGSHSGGSDAFSFDVSEFLREGANELMQIGRAHV